MRVLLVPNREYVSGIFNEIYPFSGTIRSISPSKHVAKAMAWQKNINDLVLIVFS